MTAQRYVPERGDVIWLDVAPQAGPEQRGQRPVLVLSPAAYNGRVGLAVCCPITSQVKGYPFEVPFPEGLPVKGVVLADQVKSLDWDVRQARLLCRAPADVVEEVAGKLLVLVR